MPSRGTAELVFPKLVELLGDEAYDILELPQPDPDLQRLSSIWPTLPKKIRKELADRAEKYSYENDPAEKSTELIHKTP